MITKAPARLKAVVRFFGMDADSDTDTDIE